MKTRSLFIACLSLCLALPQCKEKENGNKEDNSKIKTITLVDATTTLTVGVGEEKEVSVTVTPTNATEAIEWVSIDESKATVTAKPGDDRKATVKGINGGSTEIYAVTASGIESAYRIVNVDESIRIVSITIPSAALDLIVGDEQEVSVVSVTPSTSDEAIEWKSTDPTKVTVTLKPATNGRTVVVKGIATGSAQIYAVSAEGGIESLKRTVTVSAYQDYPLVWRMSGSSPSSDMTATDHGSYFTFLVTGADDPNVRTEDLTSNLVSGTSVYLKFEYKSNRPSRSGQIYLVSASGITELESTGNSLPIPEADDWAEFECDITTFVTTYGFGLINNHVRFDPIARSPERTNYFEAVLGMDYTAGNTAAIAHCVGYEISIRNLRLRVIL